MRLAEALEAINDDLPFTKRELAIIKETVEYYYRNPRSRDTEDSMCGGCYYEHPKTGATCAVGRCMTVAGRKVLVKEGSNSASIKGIRVDYYLKKKYKGMSDSFWMFLQELHDSNHFWNKQGARGLTEYGLEFIKSGGEI